MNKNENIEFKRMLDILNNKKRIIALILILFIALGYLYSYYYVVPEYKSTSTLLLIPNDDETVTSSDLTLNSGLISTYGNIAKNSKVLKQVINNLNLNIQEGQLLSKIEINIIKDTHIMEISVSDTDPQMATNITKELSNVFLNEIKQIYNLNNIGIVDEAQLPDTPYNINHIKDMFMFVCMGIVVSFAYIVIIYLFDNTIKKEEDIEEYIKIKSLGSVPINNDKSEIINRENTKTYITESINTIRTNILYMNSTKNAKTILITSCMPREGKSWISTNIAASFAETNKKVLLVDADMRKGRINKIFKVDNRAGLSNYLFNMNSDVEKDVYLAKEYIKETKIPNLHILTNGTIPPNPSELLASSNMKELLAILKSIYDIIIIDAPPCKLVSDSIVLSTIVDSSVIVTNSGNTKISDLKEIKKSINIVGGKIIGAIVNKAKIKGKKYSKKYQNESDLNTYNKNEKSQTVEELIEKAIPKLAEKNFDLFLYENDLVEEQEEEDILLEQIVNNTNYEKNENIQRFVNDQNKYLEKVITTVSDMKTQLNANIMQDSIKNKKQSETFQETINRKLDEIKEQSSSILKDEIQNINNEKDFEKISSEIEQVRTNYENILEQIREINNKEEKFYNNYPDEIDNIYSEIKNVKDNYKEIIQEIKENNDVNTNELVKQLNDKSLTQEDVRDILKEEIPDNLEDINNIYSEIKNVKDDYKQIIQEIKENNDVNTSELVKHLEEKRLTQEDIRDILKEEINENRLTQEDIRGILKEEIPDNSEDINSIYSEIKNVKDDYKQIIQEIKENNESNTNELIEQLNNEKLTGEDIKEILKEEVLNNIYTNDIEKIYEEVKDTKTNYEKLFEKLQDIPNIDIIAEQIVNNKMTGEEIGEIFKNSISEINYEEDIEKIYNKIEDTKINYKNTIEEIVDINNEKLLEVLKREEKNKEQIQNLLNDKMEEIQENNNKFLQREISNIDYTQQINQMNEMISSLKDSYLELSNIIRSNSIKNQYVENNSNNNINETNQNSEDNDDNVIDIKMLKKQKEQAKQRQKIKSFSINEDISYAELEETATCIIKIPKNNIGKSSSQNYGNMI